MGEPEWASIKRQRRGIFVACDIPNNRYGAEHRNIPSLVVINIPGLRPFISWNYLKVFL